MEDINIQNLIAEHTNRMPHLKYYDDVMIPYYEYPDMDSYYCWLAKAERFLEINYPDDKYIADYERISNQNIDPDQQKKLLTILEAFAALPIAIPRTKPSPKKQGNELGPINVTTNINNSNSQTQSQQQSLTVELFLDVIKDNLMGRQIKELKAMVAEADNNMEKARPRIIAQLNSFGADVASNIVANRLTNTVF